MTVIAGFSAIFFAGIYPGPRAEAIFFRGLNHQPGLQWCIGALTVQNNVFILLQILAT